MSPAPKPLNPFRVLAAHRNFRLFWIGQTLSLVGTWMQAMAQGWLALELTDNAFLVGLVGSIGSLPILLFSLHAGAIVDRTDKLRLVTAMQAVLLGEATLIFLFTWTGYITIGWLLALATVGGVAAAFEIPARQAMMAELVGREDLSAAIALNSSGFNLARILGPSVAAVVIAQLGLAWCFAVNALSYLAVLAGLAMIRLPRWTPRAAAGSPWEGVKQGLRYVARTPEVSALMRLITVFAVFGVSYLTLMPVVARDLLHLGPSGYGVLLACVGVGGLSGALFLASAGHRFRQDRLLMTASASYAVLLVVFAFVRSERLAAVVLLATGFAMIVNGAVANGMLQARVPDELRGRLMAAYSFVVVGLGSVVGNLIGGAAARAVGVEWAIGGGAGVMILYLLTIGWGAGALVFTPARAVAGRVTGREGVSSDG